ncbi:MAG: fibronectin type III domain-containing protein [Eubacterium sp.]|nr:fibronectin type III domain-containing protein [Eubacterium sp.]
MRKCSKLSIICLLAAFIMFIAFHTDSKAASQVSFTSYTDNSITISWVKPSESGLTIQNYTIETGGKVVSQVSGTQTSATIGGLPKGWTGYVRVYYNGLKTYSSGSVYQLSNYIIGGVYANTTPETISENNVGVGAYFSLKKAYIQANIPTNATGVQYEAYKGKKRVLNSTNYSVSDNFKFVNNAVYKYRARSYYKNSSNNVTYYGAWSPFKYFAVPKASAVAKYNKKGATLTVYRTPGVKYYKVYVTTKSGGTGLKLSKTIKVTSKKKYKVQLTKKLKKKKINYIHIIPYIKVGSKVVKSSGWPYMSLYIYK